MSATRTIVRRLRASLLALAVLPTIAVAQRGGGGGAAGGPPRDPMQELLPLRPTRTLTFTTKSGNWMSSDVNKDGTMITFDLLGDIYTMPISGGKATAFTRGMGFDAQPRFSPDGKKIVFVSDRTGGYNLWTISIDKKDTVQITTGNTNTYESPIWTPDGKYIIATRGTKLWLFPAEGGTGIQLIRAEGAAAATGGRGGGGGAAADVTREEGPAMGKDARYIYFAQRRGRWVYNTKLGDYDLMQYDRETGQVSTKENRWGSAFRPTLSPDGKWLVYGTRYVDQTRLRIRNLANNEEEWLTGAVQRDDQESLATLDVYPGMSFTPDSKNLVATWNGKLWKIAIDTKVATEIPFEADVVQPMGPHVAFEYPISDSATFTVKQIRDAVASPDGKRLAFVALDHLYVMEYPNGTPKRVTNSSYGEFEPVWSPDGQYLAYTTWADSIGYLQRVRSDGSGTPQRLTPQEGVWTNPVYTPNGQRILASRAPSRSFRTGTGGGGRGGGNSELVWIPATGGQGTHVADGTQGIHFSQRDTSRIFAYGGQRGIYSMRWDGTDIKNIARIAAGGAGAAGGGGGRGGGASWAQLSPDGTHALAQINLDLYYIPDIPWPGGTEPTLTVSEGGRGGAAGGGLDFPSRKLTDIGAQFPSWGDDSKTIHWSIGNAHAVYDIARAYAFDDSVRKANPVRAGGVGAGAGDSTGAGGGRAGGRGGPPLPTYKPVETRIKLQAPRDIPKSTAVLRGARIITMNGQEVIDKGDIVVVNNRITAIGKSGSVKVPAGAKSIDMSGKTITPGFVDTHAHLRLASNVHRTPVWSYAANLAYGVTTARDPQTGTTDVLTYEDEDKAGLVLSPRIYSTGPGVFAAENIRSLENARTVLKRYAEYYDTKTIKEYETGNREVRQWVIQAANELKLMPTTEGGLDVKMNMTEAIDGYSGHEHTIPTYPLQSDVIRLLSESGITYTPTLIVSYGAPWAENYWYEHTDMLHDNKLQLFTPWSDLEGKILRRGGSTGAVTTAAEAGWFHDSQYNMKIVGADIKHLIDAGGSAGVGSHGQQQGVGFHWELWNIGMGEGMTPHDALRVATIYGAKALGLGKDLGSLEVGKLADLLVFDKNPMDNLQNTTTLRSVMKNGRMYNASNLDQTYPQNVKGAPFPWNEDDSPTRDKLLKPLGADMKTAPMKKR
ncbi:MAG: amidohydrolase family protein [Gemmatimonadaceae bacterium]